MGSAFVLSLFARESRAMRPQRAPFASFSLLSLRARALFRSLSSEQAAPFLQGSACCALAVVREESGRARHPEVRVECFFDGSTTKCLLRLAAQRALSLGRRRRLSTVLLSCFSCLAVLFGGTGNKVMAGLWRVRARTCRLFSLPPCESLGAKALPRFALDKVTPTHNIEKITHYTHSVWCPHIPLERRLGLRWQECFFCCQHNTSPLTLPRDDFAGLARQNME